MQLRLWDAGGEGLVVHLLEVWAWHSRPLEDSTVQSPCLSCAALSQGGDPCQLQATGGHVSMASLMREPVLGRLAAVIRPAQEKMVCDTDLVAAQKRRWFCCILVLTALRVLLRADRGAG